MTSDTDLVRLGFNPGNYRRRTRLTLRWIEAHYLEPITTAEIAAVTEWSERGLQDAFHTELDTTPLRLVRRLRLQYARTLLEEPRSPATIREIARASWMMHLGRFSGYYVAEYGELPSETRARIRAATR